VSYRDLLEMGYAIFIGTSQSNYLVSHQDVNIRLLF